MRWTLPLFLNGGLLLVMVVALIVFRQSALDRLEYDSQTALLRDLAALNDELHQAGPQVAPLRLLEWNLKGMAGSSRWREAVVVDPSGRILLSLHTPLLGQRIEAALPVPSTAFPPLGPDLLQTRFSSPYLLGALAVSLGDSSVGRLLVVEDLSTVRGTVLSEVERQVLYGSIPLLLLGWGMWWLLHRAVAPRMNLLRSAEAQLAAGDYSVQLKLSGQDELARMGRAFDVLVEHLGRERARAQEQEDLLVTILEHSPIMVFLKDEQGRYLLGNRVLAEQAGIEPGALIGKVDRQLWSQSVWQVLEEHDRQTLAAGSPQVFEEVLGHNGGRRTYLTVRFPLDGDREGGARLGGVGTDITRRLSLEGELHRKDELLACLAFTAEQFLLADPWGARVAVVLEHLGQAAEAPQVYLYSEAPPLMHFWRMGEGMSSRHVALDGLGLRWWKGALCHEGVLIRDRIHFTPSEWAVLEPHGIESLLLVPIATAQGWWGFLGLASGAPRRWRAGEIEALQAHAGLIGAVVARHDATRDLAHSENRFRAVFEQSGIGMVVTARDGRFLAVNPAFAGMLGYTPQQMVGWTFLAITHPEDSAMNFELYRRFIAGEIDDYTLEKRYLGRDGRTVWARLVVRRLREEGEGVVLALIEDITTQKEMAQALEQAEARYRNIIATSNEGFVVVDPGLRIVEVNDAMLRILGYRRHEVLGKRAIRYTAKEHWGLLRYWRRHPDQIPQREIEMTAWHRQGHTVELLLSISPLHQEGRLEGYVAFASDLSQRKRVDQAILAAKVFERTSEAVVITDGDANIVDVNAAWERVTGYRREEVVGQNPRIMRSGRHDATFYQKMWRALLEEGRWEGEIWDRRKDGREYPKHLVIDAVRGESGAVTHYVGIFTDITQAKAREETLHRMAHRDHLTGLPNRGLFLDRLEQAMQRTRRSAEPFALLFLDLDGFKGINDRLGHRVGDEVLIEVARRLTGIVRQSDTVCRLGGDEFTVLLGEVEGGSGGNRSPRKSWSPWPNRSPPRWGSNI